MSVYRPHADHTIDATAEGAPVQSPESAARRYTKADAGTAQGPHTCSEALALACKAQIMPEEVGSTGMEAKPKLCT